MLKINYIEGKPVFRRSDLESLLKCGYQFELTHQETDYVGPEHTSEPLFVGTMFHLVMSKYFKSVMEGYWPSRDDLILLAQHLWQTSDSIVTWTTSPTGALEVLTRLVGNYFDWLGKQDWKDIDPISSENTRLLELDSCWITGTTDLETKVGGIIDFKTAATYEAGKDIAKESIQPAFYSLLVSEGDINKAADIPFDFHVVTKDKLGTVHQIRAYTTIQDLSILKEVYIPRAVKIMQAGLFLPNTMYKWCSPKYCPVWKQCRGFNPLELVTNLG